MSDKPKGNFLLQAWLVLILAIFFGSALAGVQLKLAPVIAANQINEIQQRLPEVVLDDAAMQKLADAKQALEFQPHRASVDSVGDTAGRKTTYQVYAARYPDHRPAGWVVRSEGAGYADKIDLLFGIDAGGERLTGLFILEQKETPGLGNKIVSPEFRNQFSGKHLIQPLTVVKGGHATGNQIDSITGATISSRSVTHIINTAAANLRSQLPAFKKKE